MFLLKSKSSLHKTTLTESSKCVPRSISDTVANCATVIIEFVRFAPDKLSLKICVCQHRAFKVGTAQICGSEVRTGQVGLLAGLGLLRLAPVISTPLIPHARIPRCARILAFRTAVQMLQKNRWVGVAADSGALEICIIELRIVKISTSKIAEGNNGSG